MKWIFSIVTLLAVACSSGNKKPAEIKAPLNPGILEMLQFVADSLAPCNIWLAQDYRVRRFFDEDDLSATRLTDLFDHDQILSWYQSMDTTSQLDYTAYLDSLNVPYIASADSILNCASAINTVAFSHKGTEALLLFVAFDGKVETSYSLLLEKASLREKWYVADTLWHETSLPK